MEEIDNEREEIMWHGIMRNKISINNNNTLRKCTLLDWGGTGGWLLKVDGPQMILKLLFTMYKA
uniref:Uncharacterized protein n=1 Tax=Cucumis melo TaxID=3656 RepID=A0A9I9ECX3_CUCME